MFIDIEIEILTNVRVQTNNNFKCIISFIYLSFNYNIFIIDLKENNTICLKWIETKKNKKIVTIRKSKYIFKTQNRCCCLKIKILYRFWHRVTKNIKLFNTIGYKNVWKKLICKILILFKKKLLFGFKRVKAIKWFVYR